MLINFLCLCGKVQSSETNLNGIFLGRKYLLSSIILLKDDEHCLKITRHIEIKKILSEKKLL